LKKIQEQRDIDILCRTKAVSPPLLDHVEQYFCRQRNELGCSNDNHFELGQQHQIMLIEPGDNLKEVISKIWGHEMPSLQENVFGIEYVEKHSLSDGSLAYRIAIMPDNECMTTLFMLAGTQEWETEAWLQSQCFLSANELILQKLRLTFERNNLCPGNSYSPDHVWVMAASSIPFNSRHGSKPFMPTAMTHNESWADLLSLPTHYVRVILRTTSTQGINSYVDGTDFCMIVDEQRQTVEFFWEDECFGAAPKCEGSSIESAMAWLKQMGEPLHLQLDDPFLTKELRNQLPSIAEADISKANPSNPLPPDDFTDIF
jgi:hypothetical protein